MAHEQGHLGFFEKVTGRSAEDGFAETAVSISAHDHQVCIDVRHVARQNVRGPGQ